MNYSKVSIGKNPPEEFNVIIEVPMNSDPIKYEFDKDSGAVFVDRFIHASMHYPCNYGFIPHTLSGDGDPCDVLVICDLPILPGFVIAVRPIGVLLMDDESGSDEKILAVPTKKIDPTYAGITSYKQLPEFTTAKIKHFFEHYKDLEPNKWVKVTGWYDEVKAKELILEAVERAKKAA